MSSIHQSLGGRAAWLCLFFVLTHCGPAPSSEWKLLSDEFAPAWKASGMPEEGQVLLQDGEITLQPGQPMTGVRFDAWKSSGLPLTRYAIEYEAMRVAGNDFFGTVTFPVNESQVSLIIGGWGGTLVGISSIDDMDASENTTRGNAFFENNRWHKVRIEVRNNELRAWINDKLFVNTNIKGRKLGLRTGDIERCVPFGFASYATQSRIRNVLISRL
ncbi:MAG: hypothetical protein B7Z37_12840 [Verrucomicrobia bacterium 12-59-8]|nr:MAG: hypothetical protein B7Z37_12840 [Verrucomicrobia bacterium 12-59-8]